MTDYHELGTAAPDEFEIDALALKAGGPSGKSTLVHTVFNAVNVLVGMGVLCLPLGLKLAGWLCGLLLLFLAPLITWYTALLLGRIIAKHPQLETYSDVGRHTLSKPVYAALLATFMLDLFGAALTLTILFTDSFRAIIGASPIVLRAVICIGLFTMSFLPLTALSKLSMLGVASMAGIITVLAGSGLVKHESPGSIQNPMTTSLWPESFGGFLISIGIIMAPWAGHVVFPELQSDMKFPQQYPKAVTATYFSAWFIEASTAILGYLMFGSLTMPEITGNILEGNSSPVWLLTLVTFFLGLLPIAKLPLFTLPVISFVDGVLPLNSRYSRTAARALVAVGLFVCSMLITDFARVQSILGSVICVVTCITAPLVFYMAVFQLSPFVKRVFFAAIGASVIVSIACTTAVLLT